MKYLDLTFPEAALNLAGDEALLDAMEENPGAPTLRFWEPARPFVVLGYANRISEEVRLEVCRLKNIPVFRRSSGGGTVLQGPGCLNYTLVLPFSYARELESVAGTNRYLLGRISQALKMFDGRIACQGTSDLALGDRKFSGNAQRRKRASLLFHGTFLLSMDLGLIEEVLPLPRRQPAYRRNRSHQAFLANLEIPGDQVKGALRNEWQAVERLWEVPQARLDALAHIYKSDEWTLKF